MPIDPQPGFPAVLEAQKKLLNVSQEIVDRLLNFTRPYYSQWDEFFRHYVGRADQKYYPDAKTLRSSTFVPYPFANVNFVRSSIMGDIFAFMPPFETLPRGEKDTEASIAMQRVLELMVLNGADLHGNFNKFLGGLCIYGRQPWKVEWDWGYDTVLERQPQPVFNPDGSQVVNQMTGQPMLLMANVPVKVPHNRPRITVLDNFDYLADPDGAFVAVMFDKTFPQMVRENEHYKTLHDRPLYDEDAMGKLEELVKRLGEKAQHALIHMAELWDVVEGKVVLFTAREDLERLTHKDLRITNRAGSSYNELRRLTAEAPPMLLSHGLNPYAHKQVPVLLGQYNEVPGDQMGMGIIEPTWASVEALNMSMDLIVDNWVMGVNQRLVIDGSRPDIDYNELQKNNVPGGVFISSGPVQESVGTLPVHTPSPGDYSILPMLRNMIEMASNVSDPYNRGVGATAGNRTATGITSVIQQSNVGRVALTRNLCSTILEPTLQLCASMVQQYITDDIEIRITDEMPAIPKVNSMFKTIKPSELVGNFDFRIVGSAYMENPLLSQRTFTGLLNLLKGSPFLKQYEASREAVRIHRVPYPNRLLYTPEEVQQMQQQQTAQRMQEAQRMRQMGITPEQLKENASMRQDENESRRTVQFEGEAPITGGVRTQGQEMGANAFGLGGLSEFGAR